MRATTVRRAVAVHSAGQALTIVATTRLIEAWPRIAPGVPGASADLAAPAAAGPPPVAVPGDLGDARRLINACLHVLHLAHGTLAVHAVAMHRPGTGAVLLLGGHGAGKTLTALALHDLGWQWLTGDVTLLHAGPGGLPRVRGGTTALLARRGPVRRWFPRHRVPEAGPDVVDLRDRPGITPAAQTPAGPVVGAFLVDVDADPATDGRPRPVDAHTTETVWWKASGHLLDRVLTGEDLPPLRSLEDERAQMRRARQVRALARSGCRMALARGTPHAIAAQIDHIISRPQGAHL